jgi:hypothetical protein
LPGKEVSMRKSFRDAVRFFSAHAGGVVGHCWEGALHLANAEQHAFCADWTFTWEHDDAPDLGDHTEWCARAARGRACSHEVLVCVLRDADGTVLASLGGVIDASRDYARVVEAELADEALANQRAENRAAALFDGTGDAE